MIKIPEVSTPKTLRTFTTSNGEKYVLKGGKTSVQDLYKLNNLKLYKKVKVDGMDTFQLVGKKEEKSLINARGPKKFISIKKENYDSAGRMTEQSAIYENVFGGKNIEYNGDVLKLQGAVLTNTKNDKIKAEIDTTVGKLTPMAKRIIKILFK